MRLRIYPYKMRSGGSEVLSCTLPALRVFPNGRFRPRTSDIIINWGNSTPPSWNRENLTVLNKWDNVHNAIDKIKAFTLLSAANLSVPKYTTSRDEASHFFVDNGIVVCRTNTTGSGGRGIVIARNIEELVDAPLYTRHVRHRDEFRVHVAFGSVIDFAKKKKRNATEGVNILVRNHGDWVFCREGVVLPDLIPSLAVGAIQALGLDFGAVDIGYRRTDDKAYVFEVNTAPGFDSNSTTAAKYVAAFKTRAGL